jgi:hypothetical protein
LSTLRGAGALPIHRFFNLARPLLTLLAGRLHSLDCQEEVFSETHIAPVRYPCIGPGLSLFTELPLSRLLRNWGFRCKGFSETQFLALLILGNPICRGSSVRSGPGLHARASAIRGSRKLAPYRCKALLTTCCCRLVSQVTLLLPLVRCPRTLKA